MIPGELISKKTRQEFREYFVGCTLRQIEMAFDEAGIACDNDHHPEISGERRTLVEQYYSTLDFTKPSDVRKLLRVYEHELVELENASAAGQSWSAEAQRRFVALRRWLERDGFAYKDGHLNMVGTQAPLDDVHALVATLDAPELQRQVDRMRSAAQDDPGLAIGTAKELLETTCKTILTERGIIFQQDWELTKLLKETREVLGLLPEQMPDEAKGLDVLRKLLGNLGTVAQSLAELRNLYGTGHGKHGKAKGLEARHARLAVGAAATLATFLFETHQARRTGS